MEGTLKVDPGELLRLSSGLEETAAGLSGDLPTLDTAQVGNAAVASALHTFATNWNYHRREVTSFVSALAKMLSTAGMAYLETEAAIRKAATQRPGSSPANPGASMDMLPVPLPSLGGTEDGLRNGFLADWRPSWTNAKGEQFDQWSFAYNSNGNCTSYAAWRLNQLAAEQGLGEDWFSNSHIGDRGTHMGNGADWGNGARDAGYPPDGTPRAGAVAWWDANSPLGGYGHVAIVRSVDAHGTIVVEESAWGSYVFKTERIARGDSRYPTGFLHLVPGT